MKTVLYNHKLEPLAIIEVDERLLVRDTIAVELTNAGSDYLRVDNIIAHVRPVKGRPLKAFRMLVLPATEQEFIVNHIPGAVTIKDGLACPRNTFGGAG